VQNRIEAFLTLTYWLKSFQNNAPGQSEQESLLHINRIAGNRLK
jgi:hypothetical protein